MPLLRLAEARDSGIGKVELFPTTAHLPPQSIAMKNTHVTEDCWRNGASVALTVICDTRMEQDKHKTDSTRSSTIKPTCRASTEAVPKERHFCRNKKKLHFIIQEILLLVCSS
jgi:hypothetical protein